MKELNGTLIRVEAGPCFQTFHTNLSFREVVKRMRIVLDEECKEINFKEQIKHDQII